MYIINGLIVVYVKFAESLDSANEIGGGKNCLTI